MGNFFSDVDKELERLKIDIYSPIFEEMLDQVNRELLKVVKNVHEGKFDSGSVKLNLKFEIYQANLEVPQEDPKTKEIKVKILPYKHPKFSYETTSVLNQKHKVKGEYNERREIKLEDENYIVCSVFDPQTKLDLKEAEENKKQDEDLKNEEDKNKSKAKKTTKSSSKKGGTK